MTPEERDKLIAQYKAGYEEVTESLKEFPEDAMGDRPIPGKWSAREIVHHLADSETASSIRLRKLLTEDHAIIQGYDEADYAVRLRYNERADIRPALAAFDSARANCLQLIDQMTEEDWQREGEHTHSGRYTAETWMAIYAVHAHNHAAQIRRLREALHK